MARDFFKNLPNTTTPLTAPRLNGLLDGDEPMGNIVVDSIRTKNMFDETQLLQASDWTINSSGYYNGTLSNFNTRFTNGFTFDKSFKTGTQYTFSANGYVSGGTCLIVFVYSDNTYENLTINQTSATNLTFTTPSNKTLSKIRGTYSSGGSNTFYIKNIQLEEGTTNTDYTEYQGLGLGYVSGKNAKGNYVKYDDGRLEVWGKKEIGTVAITSVNGNLYESVNQSSIDFPYTFIETPEFRIITPYSASGNCMIINASSPTTSGTGSYLFTRGSSSTLNNVIVCFRATGRWK